jgi:hypothetical protein
MARHGSGDEAEGHAFERDCLAVLVIYAFFPRNETNRNLIITEIIVYFCEYFLLVGLRIATALNMPGIKL